MSMGVDMRKACSVSVVLLSSLLFFTSFAFAASFLNAPHTESNGVFCKDCHEHPFANWPGAVPAVPTIDETVKNFVCLKCHGPNGGAPTKAMHSSLTMNGTELWTAECVACHDPHFQSQLSRFTVDGAELYLITGLINNLTPQGTTTRIQYTGTYIKPAWSDTATWGAKTGPGRGLIFVADKNNPKDTFEIISADAATITVDGTVAANAVGKTFGIIYGQLIRPKVVTPVGEREVKFFDPTGGFVDTSGSTSPTGICQVCHANTLYWTADGANNSHNVGSNCTSCHDAAQGFKATVHDHSLSVTAASPCNICHTQPDVVGAIHLGNCATCHESTRPEVVAAIAAGSANCNTCHGTDFLAIHPATVDHSASVQVAAGCDSCHTAILIDPADPKVHNGCASCHDAKGGLVGSASGNPAPNDCATCHSANFIGIHPATVNHSASVALSAECAACHTATLIDPADPKVHNDCASCHAANGSLIGSASGNTSPNECITCHGSYFPSHKHLHTVSLGAGDVSQDPPQPCGNCHVVATWDQINGIEHNVATNGPTSCDTCHSSPRSEVITAIAAGANPTNCLACHSDKQSPAAHGSANHVASGYVTTAPSCITSGCHDTATVDPIANTHRGICASCHADTTTGDYTLVGSASGHRVPEDGVSNDCTTCHGAGHTMAEPYDKCADCHTGEHNSAQYGGSVHNKHINEFNGNCAACHNRPDPPCLSCHFDTPQRTHNKHDGEANCFDCHTTIPPGNWP